MKPFLHPTQDPGLSTQDSALRTQDSVWVTGIGVVSPLGNSVDEIARRFAAGETAIQPLPAGVPGFGASVAEIPLAMVSAEAHTRLGRLDRFCRLLLSAAFSAVDSAKLEIVPETAPRVGLSIGTGLGCLLTNAEYNLKLVEHGPAAASPRLFAYTVSSAAAGELSIALGIKGPNLTAHQGIAAGLGAVGYGFDLIRMGRADVVLAGGVDALGPALVQGLGDMGLLKPTAGARPFQDAIPGLYPAEGAAVLVLEDAAHARRRGAQPLAVIKGYAAGFEPTLTRHEAQSVGMRETLRRALAYSQVTPAAIDLVVASAHATALDRLEQKVLRDVLGSPKTVSPKQAWGECFAAHGVLAIALATAMMADESALQLALINSICYSGAVVDLVLARSE